MYTFGLEDEYLMVNNIFHNNAVDNRWTAIKVDESIRQNMVVDRTGGDRKEVLVGEWRQEL